MRDQTFTCRFHEHELRPSTCGLVSGSNPEHEGPFLEAAILVRSQESFEGGKMTSRWHVFVSKLDLNSWSLVMFKICGSFVGSYLCLIFHGCHGDVLSIDAAICPWPDGCDSLVSSVGKSLEFFYKKTFRAKVWLSFLFKPKRKDHGWSDCWILQSVSPQSSTAESHIIQIRLLFMTARWVIKVVCSRLI